LKKNVEEIIINLENANSLTEISNLKKLKGYKYSFRIKSWEL